MKKISPKAEARLLSAIMIITLFLPTFIMPSAAWSGTPRCNIVTVFLNGKPVVSPRESYQSITESFAPSSALCDDMVYLPLEILIECGISIDFGSDNTSVIIDSVNLRDPVLLRERKQDASLTIPGTSFLANAADLIVAGQKIGQVGKDISYGGNTYPSSLFNEKSVYLPITPILKVYGIDTRWDSQSHSLYLNESEEVSQNKIMSVSTNDMVIDKTPTLDVTLLEEGYVTCEILGDGQNIIQTEWSDEWQQDIKISLFITPLKNGTATIRITNSCNNETEYVSVTVNMTPKGNVGLFNFTKRRGYIPGQFTDVSSSAWYADKVKAAYEYGLMSGTGNSLFQPTRNITIAEAIVIASQLHNTYYSNGNTFQGNGIWYQPYVDYALSNRIITQSYSNYNTPISRSEFAIIMSNAFPDAALAQINTVQDNAIPDVTAGSNYYNAVYRLYRAGVLSGVGSTRKYNPDAQITRAEVATILGNMVDTNLRSKFTLNIPTAPVQPTTPILPASISITKSYLSDTMEIGESQVIPVYITPVSIALTTELAWTSSNPSVAIVKGRTVYGISAGTTIITVTTQNGLSDSWVVTVRGNNKVEPTGIYTPEINLTVPVGGQIKPDIIFYPSNTTEKELTWLSSNTSIATVSSNGMITGVRPGNTAIRVSTTNGKVTYVYITVIGSTNIASEKLVMNQTGIKIYFTGIQSNTNLFGGFTVKLRLENNSNINYTVQIEDCIVNDYPFHAIFSSHTVAGRQLNDTFDIDARFLEEHGINQIDSLVLSFRIYTTSPFRYVETSDTVIITP